MDDTIGIVGGGLAGLTAAYYLVKNGRNVTIYEGNVRLGGRVFSGKFPNGQIYENGGELIDSSHKELINLLEELNIKKSDKCVSDITDINNGQVINYVIDYPDYPNNKIKYTKINSKVKYLFDEASNDYFNKINPDTKLSIFQQISIDSKNVFPTNFIKEKTVWPLKYNPNFKHIDTENLEEYINRLTSFLRKDKDGSKTKLSQLFSESLQTEFGKEINKVSPINFLKLFYFNRKETTEPRHYQAGKVPSKFFNLYGDSDEKYHTYNGNSSIIDELTKYLQNSKKCEFKMGFRLTKIKYCYDSDIIDEYKNKPYRLSFRTMNNCKYKYTYKHIIIAIPFSTIRKDKLFSKIYVDIKKANFSPLKKYAIENLPIGKNSKLNVQFKSKFWKENNSDGSIYSYKNTFWDVSINNDNTKEKDKTETGILVDFKGGKQCNMHIKNKLTQNIKKYNNAIKKETDLCLKTLNKTFPDAKKNFEYMYDKNTKKITNSVLYNWKYSPWSKGSYSYWAPGQYNGYKNFILDETDANQNIISFAGYEGVPEPYNKEQTGNCHFAGEHTSFLFQAYMNGAVESGIRVANEIIRLT